VAVKELPLSYSYDKQRFPQFSPADIANWYAVEAPTGKKQKALYPVMGRRHVQQGNQQILDFDIQPRKLFKSISYSYVVVGSTIYRIDVNFNVIIISDATFTQYNGNLNFAFLPTTQIVNVDTPSINNQYVFCAWVDGNNMFIYNEATNVFAKVTDQRMQPFPSTVAAFGNRFVIGSTNSTQFQLTQINLGQTFTPATVFSFGIDPDYTTVFAQESGLIRQMAVLHNNLYIFTDYTTGIWSNTQSTVSTSIGGSTVTASFPWKKNTSYDFDYGIADPNSLDIDFGMLVWLAQNRNGLVQFMSSNGQSPQPISTQAINVLIQKIATLSETQSLLNLDTVGFLYQYEDTIFYRVSIGPYIDYATLDNISLAVCLEYNFNTQTWGRCIEQNGQRNRIEDHVFFANKHLVTAINQTFVFEMSGVFYTNEVQKITQTTSTIEEHPFRYEMVTPIIANTDYSEFITDYVQIDFVWGDGEITTSVMENPHVELYFSDDGGISFTSVDSLQFSNLGIYSWRMRWYQCGPSRNRVYKLICVSKYPIVILGAIMDVRHASGGAN